MYGSIFACRSIDIHVKNVQSLESYQTHIFDHDRSLVWLGSKKIIVAIVCAVTGYPRCGCSGTIENNRFRRGSGLNEMGCKPQFKCTNGFLERLTPTAACCTVSNSGKYMPL